MTLTKKTALITGASSGIGYALAHEFAQAGYDVVVIGRNQSALMRLSNECKQRYNTDIFTLSQDLTQEDALVNILSFIEKNNLSITCLVNNAGVGVWGGFDKTSLEDELKMINLHICFYLKLTKALLPSMCEKNAGEILNVGSVYSFSAVAYQSVYAASKAFLLSHTLALRHELVGTNIKICISCPGITETNFRKDFFKNEKKSFFAMTAEEVARKSFRGLQANQAVVIPGVVNNIYVFLHKILPMKMFSKANRWINVYRNLHKVSS